MDYFTSDGRFKFRLLSQLLNDQSFQTQLKLRFSQANYNIIHQAVFESTVRRRSSICFNSDLSHSLCTFHRLNYRRFESMALTLFKVYSLQPYHPTKVIVDELTVHVQI
jgi:hypothetical protein